MFLQKMALIAIGFSIVSAVMLLVTFSAIYRKLNKSWLSIASAGLLLITFFIVQILHFNYLHDATDLFSSKWYSSLILISAPLFYLFVREYISVSNKVKPTLLLHFVPLVVNLFISNRYSIPLAFLIGSTYTLICGYYIFSLKEQRQRFLFELFALAFFLAIAIAIFLLGISTPTINESYFISGYAILIGLSFLLVVTTLLIFPDVATNLSEAVESKYAKSTLKSVDRKTTLAKLSQLVEHDKLYCNENLNLAMLAEQLGLNAHQVSELINSEFGFGFSRYIRNQRVAEAMRLLIDNPTDSILSISLSTGFTSQSSFYTAFGEIVGTSPGNYRKQQIG